MREKGDYGEIVNVRIPPIIMEEVRKIAAKEYETPSVILRRLIRRGLALEKDGSDVSG